MKYQAIIGLEIHVQISKTPHKMFATEQTTYGNPPNTQTSAVTLAHPGTLPSLNQQAIQQAIKIGIATQSTITKENWFDRKSYFYPDLPKGFQITQQTTPICRNGKIIIDIPTPKTIHLERIHLEEDTGKTIHTINQQTTLIDFNRAGQPLIEIVTKPEMTSAEEAVAFAKEIQRLVRYLEISNGNMEEGSLRCDANVSVMPINTTVLGQKVELKNMNSFGQIKLAITEEIRRQIDQKKKGKDILPETRSYNSQTGKNEFQRSKQSLSGYRYIIEPNLPPFTIHQNLLEHLTDIMPILPRELAHKFATQYKLPPTTVAVLVDDKETALFFEQVCQHSQHRKTVANWIMGPIKSYLNSQKVSLREFPLTASTIAILADIVAQKITSFSTASQKVFPLLIQNPSRDPYEIVQEQQLNIHHQDKIHTWIQQAIANYPDKLQQYQEGKTSLLGLFMGEVMKISDRKADPQKTRILLQQALAQAAQTNRKND